jgi:hypothetical protein
MTFITTKLIDKKCIIIQMDFGFIFVIYLRESFCIVWREKNES